MTSTLVDHDAVVAYERVVRSIVQTIERGHVYAAVPELLTGGLVVDRDLCDQLHDLLESMGRCGRWVIDPANPASGSTWGGPLAMICVKHTHHTFADDRCDAPNAGACGFGLFSRRQTIVKAIREQCDPSMAIERHAQFVREQRGLPARRMPPA